MKSTKNRLCGGLTELLDQSTGRRIFAQRQVRSESAVVVGVRFHDPTQVALAQDHDMVQAFPTDRADHSLRMAVLPW